MAQGRCWAAALLALLACLTGCTDAMSSYSPGRGLLDTPLAITPRDPVPAVPGASWGAYLTRPGPPVLSDDPTNVATNVSDAVRNGGVVLLSNPAGHALVWNITLDGPFDASDQLMSILISQPSYIDQPAVTLARLLSSRGLPPPVGSATWTLSGRGVLGANATWDQLLNSLSNGMAIVNVYTTNYPEPADPMGCCNNAEISTNGNLQPLNSFALPPGGLRQDHHDDQPASAGPTQGGGTAFKAMLSGAGAPTGAGGEVSLYLAPGNASITYDVSVGGFAPGTEIFNVSVIFQHVPGQASPAVGWYPFSLYSFAANRLPTPAGGLITPQDGSNFTLASGWIGPWIDFGSQHFANATDLSYSLGVAELAAGNVDVIIGTSNVPQGELQGMALPVPYSGALASGGR